MDNTTVLYENKLKKLLSKFLVPGYRIGNDVYLNILLSHLSGKDNEAQGEEIRRLPIFCEWLEEAVSQWETSHINPSPSISTFTLHLASLISVEELNFIKLNNNNVYIRLCKTLELRTNTITPSMKLGYLKMLSSFMNHKSGLDWLVSTDCWNDVLSYCLENQTLYITREGYNFMYELLNKFINVNDLFCDLVTKKILTSLEADQFNKNGLIKSEIDDSQIQKDLTPTLKLVTHILEKSYLNYENGENKISDIFLCNYQLENTLWNLLLIARDHEFIMTISKPLYLAYFLCIDTTQFVTHEQARPQYKFFCRKFSDLFNILINKQCAVNILKLCYLGHGHWQKMSKLVPPDPERKEPILFENQIIIFQILPFLFITFAFGDQRELRDDELTEIFIHKLFKITCQDTIRLAYLFRALLMSLTKAATFDLAQKAIFYLMKMRQQIHRDRAVIVFQALMYAMKYLAKLMIGKNHMICELEPYHAGFLSAMFDGLGMLIKDFKITWRESVESICLTSLTIDFLNCLNLPTKLTVQALQLMHLTIANFMPPNLALLVNDVNGSSIQTITPMLYQRLHDVNWEVRDSALEILQTIAEISHIKFPAFQKLVLDDRLCQLTVLLCSEDPESFVRASSIKAITTMLKVPIYWSDCLENEQLLDKMMRILQNESEALVRCETAKLICELFEHQLIPEERMFSVNTSMASAATHDLHWEVKVNALDFWQKVICNELSNQGMIDGAFPTVTFSKQHRKIVTLNEKEIQNRLNKVLLSLSDNGCLGVLLSTMQDKCDLPVAKKAVEITKKLSEHLKKYNMLNGDTCMDVFQGPVDTYKTSNITIETNDTELSNSVIDSIVNCSDMNLLASVFQNQMQTNQMNGDVKDLKIVKPDYFKSFIVQDLDSLITERCSWLASVDDLNSLLDDILQSYEDNDINNLDCY